MKIQEFMQETSGNISECNEVSEIPHDETAQIFQEAKIIGECYRIRVLFDTESQKTDRDYIKIIEDTWLKTFKDIDPELLEEAVQNFIVSDKKGYLPKPGQIVEFIAKEIEGIKNKRYWTEFEKASFQLLKKEAGSITNQTAFFSRLK